MKYDFDEAIDRIQRGENPLKVIENVRESDKEAVEDYMRAIGD